MAVEVARSREGLQRGARADDMPALLEILDLMSQGFSGREAAETLFESDGVAIDWALARRRLFASLGSLNEVQAYRVAVERGLIRLER